MFQLTAVVLDKDQTERDDIRNRLSHCGVLPICFKDEWICLENIHHIRPSFAVLRTDSYENASMFVNIAKAIESKFPVIVLSNNSEVESFIRNNWLADLFFLRYPADDVEFQEAIGRMNGSKAHQERPVMIAGSPEVFKQFADIPRIGASKEPLLIQGEPGVGKKLMAKAIFSCWTDRDGVLEFISSADISAPWIQETRRRIDDHRQTTRRGFFCVVEHIEDLSYELQSQLLLLLDIPIDGQRVENNPSRPIRWITLADYHIGELVRKGRFRKDLYHRLSVLKLCVPPLRGHIDDVPLLADYFATRHSVRNRKRVFRLPDKIRSALKRYHWPGNVAELKRTVNRLMGTDTSNWKDVLPPACQCHISRRVHSGDSRYVDAQDLRRFLESNRDFSLKKARNHYSAQVEKKIMKAVLVNTNGNRKKAAKLLKISYKTMLTKTKLYDIGPQRCKRLSASAPRRQG